MSWATFGIAARLLHHVFHQGAISYELGNWAPPWGIEYRVDEINALVLLIVAGIGAIVLLFARSSVEQEIPDRRIHLFYSAYLLCLAGLLGMAITGDAFNLFVFLEISSLSSYHDGSHGPGHGFSETLEVVETHRTEPIHDAA